MSDSYTLAVALTADGKLLAREGADNAVDLWEVASGKKLHALKGHTVPILRLAFSPDGKTLASASFRGANEKAQPLPGQLKLWDVATTKERATIALPGYAALQFFSLAFTADRNTLSSAMWSFHEREKEGGLAVQHWEVATGKARATSRRS